MYKKNSDYVYSASDLIVYMSSPFASWMARLAIDKPSLIEGIEKDKDELMGLLAEKGNNHEYLFLEQLKQDYGSDNVAEIEDDRKTAGLSTLNAMQVGYKIIFQAYMERDGFAGFADFLVRREGQSNLGDYYYEAWDTKLSKSTRPYFLVQLCCYSWMLEEIQGVKPEEAVVVLGDKKHDRYRIAAYYSYFQSLKQQFLTNQQNFVTDLKTMPDPALYSDYGAWGSYAKQVMENADSLALVATIRKSQIKNLREAGINTLTELANTSAEYIKGLAPESFYKIKAQADIQLRSRGQDKPLFKVLTQDKGKGLSFLPKHSPLDVFFDIEGHPLLDGGLEYLWGVSYQDNNAVQGKQYAFKDWWAHTPQQEKVAFEGFIDWVYLRYQQDPSMHVYHYASYEITAMRKLSTRNQTRLDEVAEMLKQGVFIDLYKVVKNGLLIGEPNYSIKSVEHLYRGKRTTDVANGGESVVFYENWREQGGVDAWGKQTNGYKNWLVNPDQFDWKAWPELNDIRDYNIDDCESTLELVDWLREQQQQSGVVYNPPAIDEEEEKEQTERQEQNTEKRQALIKRQQDLIDQFDNSEALQNDPNAETLVSLLHFYTRERKPQLWAYFDRLEKSDAELFDDDTVVQNITITDRIQEDKGIRFIGTFSKDQPIRTDKVSGATVKDTESKVKGIKITELNEQKSEISFMVKPEQAELLSDKNITLFADESFINTDALENRLCEITEEYFDNGKLSGAVNTIINQANPQFKLKKSPLPISRQRYPDDQEYLNAIISSIQKMDNSCMCIQGPPGSGKSYTAKHVISDLVKQGKRIGIMSNSHAAIMHLLKSVTEALPGTDIAKVGGFDNQKTFKEIYTEDEFPNLYYRGGMSFTQKQPYQSFSVIGATAYAFVKDVTHEDPIDYLFIDEASQVALANLIAISGAAKNIVLMGDQMQLEQPIQGSHPGNAGASALEFMLQGHSVIPEEKGIFLERTYRMHPAVCQPLSDVVYEGKLTADKENQNQAITIDNPAYITQENGILSIPVNHEGNTQSSEEEVVIVQKLIAELKTGTFTNKQGQKSQITDKDILIAAPYNMQVNLLKEKLGEDLKIGTIDKFQGQEAPVVIVSMAVSDVEDSSRGLGFVFDINRLNVAISRAQALAIVVANEGLENCHVNSLEQMAKVGFFCRLNIF